MGSLRTWSVCKTLKALENAFYCKSIGFLRPISVPYIHRTQQYCYSNTDLLFNHFEDSAETRFVPRTHDEFVNQQRQLPMQPQNPRQLLVAILGTPNAGKSTLTNSLVRWQVCSVSKKVHTTRQKAAAVLIEGSTQIIFLDTPGLITPEHSKRHQLETSMVSDPERSLLKADLIVVVVDAANKWTRHKLDPLVLNLLKQYSDKKSILVLNKVDLITSKHLLLEITRSLTGGVVDGKKDSKVRETEAKELNLEKLFRNTEMKLKAKKEQDIQLQDGSSHQDSKGEKGWPHFSKVFMMSALEGDGVNSVRDYMIDMAKPKQWDYHASVVTNQDPHKLAIMSVKGKILDFLPNEVPYQTAVQIEMWQLDEAGVLRICMNIICARNNHVKLLIGPGGKNISKLSDNARQELSNIFRCDVSLKLIVKSKQRAARVFKQVSNLKTDRQKPVHGFDSDDDDDNI